MDNILMVINLRWFKWHDLYQKLECIVKSFSTQILKNF